MGKQRGLWARIPRFTKIKIIGLCAFLPVCTIALVIPRGEGSARAAAVKPLADHAQLGEWANASCDTKLQWAHGYAREHLGVDNDAKALEIRQFLDASVKKQRAMTRDPRVLDALLKVDIRTMAAAGARLMDWPDPQTSD